MYKRKIQHFFCFVVFILLIFSFDFDLKSQFVVFENSVFASSNLPNKVILGGNIIGFMYEGEGVLVLSNNQKDEDKNSLKAGDVIQKLDDTFVCSCEDIENYLNDGETKEEVMVTFSRDGKDQTTKIKPTFDLLSKTFKLGIWAKDEITGLGTLTYINPETGYFGSLGHPLSEGTTGGLLPVKEGVIYDCNILSISKGAKGMPGELKGSIARSESLGTISKNQEFGVFGTITDKSLLESENLVEIGGRHTAKPGYAQIYASLDGEEPKYYDIQIIKTNYQATSNTKSLVLKVTDKELLEKTGGIVQGMSGSPIVQNGKLIGAVTHVFTNDATKGFGVYIDWMM